MDIRAVILLLAAAGLFLFNAAYVPPLSEDGEKIVVYVGAKDCGACRSFEADSRHDLVAAVRAKGWVYREFAPRSMRMIGDRAAWPADLRWVYDAAADEVRATPSFLLFDARKLKRNIRGWGGLEQTVDDLVG